MSKKTEAEWIEVWGNSWIDLKDKSIINNLKTKPINILELSTTLGIEVYNPYFSTKIEGWIEYNEKETVFEIFLNPQYPAIKQRYTLAHEISHFLFHKDEIVKQGQLDRGYLAKGFFDVREWQANLFASELLIPTDMIEEDIDGDVDLLSEKNLMVHIAKEYKVSTPVAIKRAKRAIATYKDKHS